MERLIVLLGAVGTSTSSLFVRLSTAPSMILALYRVVIATVILTPLVLLRHRAEVRQMSRRTVLLCLLSGMFLGLHFVAYFEGVRLTSIAASAVLVNMGAIFVPLGGTLFLKTRLTGKAWAAILVAFAGSLIVAMADASGGASLQGNFLTILSAVLSAAYTLVGSVCRRSGLSTTVYTYFVYGAAAVTVLLASLAFGLRLTGYGTRNLLAALGLAVFCTLLGHSVYSWGLKYLSAPYISTLKLVDPLFASLWGLLLFRERPGLQVILGGLVVIFGIAMYCRVADEQEKSAQTPAEQPAQSSRES